MKKILSILSVLFILPLSSNAMDITITWDPSYVEFPKSIAYYRVYQTYKQGNYTRNVLIRKTTSTDITMPNLPNKNIYWRVTAVDSNGIESKPSEEVTSKWFLRYRIMSKYGPKHIMYW